MLDDPEAAALARGWVDKAESWRGQRVARTHDVAALVGRLATADRPNLSAPEQEMLTRYATVTRYPGDYAPISLTEARRAVSLARRVRKFIRARLPKQDQ